MIACNACNQPGHIARHCPLIQGGNNSQQNNNRQTHFQQGEEGSEGTEIGRKMQKTVKINFLMPHNCSRVSATLTTTFISRMNDHI